jgi:hypothetical protein
MEDERWLRHVLRASRIALERADVETNPELVADLEQYTAQLEGRLRATLVGAEPRGPVHRVQRVTQPRPRP